MTTWTDVNTLDAWKCNGPMDARLLRVLVRWVKDREPCLPELNPWPTARVRAV